jgi:hypothetical protein
MADRSDDEPVELAKDAVDAVADPLIEHVATAGQIYLPGDEIILAASVPVATSSDSVSCGAADTSTGTQPGNPVPEVISAAMQGARAIDTGGQLKI